MKHKNIFDNPDDDDNDSIAVPELLLKEEFYRTFIMVAGKIPLWAVQPSGLEPEQLSIWKKKALEYGGFIDLGTFDTMPVEEIQRGLLWQICKAPYDPVKSVIKASMTASYQRSEKSKTSLPVLLCDKVKQRFGQSIIDDYAADPYIIAFERILEFYTEIGDPRALSQVKAAIFFRLCGFPLVALPAKDSPKRKILDRYVRQWQLSSTRLKKLLEYQIWPESEKTLFDHTMIERLSVLYKRSLDQDSDNSYPIPVSSKKEMDLKILKNKVNKIIHKKKGVLPHCSTYLGLKPHSQMTIIAKKKDENIKSFEWLLFSQVQNSPSLSNLAQSGQEQKGAKDKNYSLLYSTEYFLKTVGWSMSNHLYIRGTTNLKTRSPFKLYKSMNKEADCDDIYLALQPWMPLSDEPFLSEPFWEKIVVLLFTANDTTVSSNTGDSATVSSNTGDSGTELTHKSIEQSDTDKLHKPEHAEFLVRNSWGEIFFEVMNLEQIDNLEKRCYHTAMKILEYHEKQSHYTIFQMASKPIPKLIQRIKTIVEDTKVLKKNSDMNNIRRRPYLDTI
ncbi:MAG: class I adenylate cyclase [Desulfamplus sp.]|nr:class I adenylate cyclase [Desulfamplus sp.]